MNIGQSVPLCSEVDIAATCIGVERECRIHRFGEVGTPKEVRGSSPDGQKRVCVCVCLCVCMSVADCGSHKLFETNEGKKKFAAPPSPASKSSVSMRQDKGVRAWEWKSLLQHQSS